MPLDTFTYYLLKVGFIPPLRAHQASGTTGGGSPKNGFTPTTTLGCGSWGNNSFSGNFSHVHLMNITRVSYPFAESYLPDPEMAWD